MNAKSFLSKQRLREWQWPERLLYDKVIKTSKHRKSVMLSRIKSKIIEAIGRRIEAHSESFRISLHKEIDSRIDERLQNVSIYRMADRLASNLKIGQASPNALFGSSLCRMEDMLHPGYQKICFEDLKRKPILHRKQWEHAFIIHRLRAHGRLYPGFRGLGFGVGTESLPSLFVSLGCNILATDAPENPDIISWKNSDQHANSLISIWREEMVEWDLFEKACRFAPLDMNNHLSIPHGYDFHWSSCVIEHLGGIREAQDFILNSISALAPGGIAVHTTEFNLSSETETVDEPGTCILRAKDIFKLQNEVEDRGFKVDPIILDPGSHPYNYHVDSPPYQSSVHLRLLLDGYASTSIGFVVKKP
ncbi:hypothetical protein KBY79_12000 [Synechococcus lacustris C3-12m-Tous]|uniref:hypothetical protein n=1 Tax=Synechococcus lacustris TaxID=2116544 RepID=UPI0020CF2314|nr:hypothetical protein [Synechococcus lacustris]MCP9925930.1 hypothetical protein [Synechococcus lacustris C3-12m-Tous]